MEVDEDDSDMINNVTLKSVVLHKMGHTYGIGNFQESFGFIKGCTAKDPNAYYILHGSILGQKMIGGKGKQLVETRGGPGTALSHWDLATYDSELMIGKIKFNPRPLFKFNIDFSC